MKLGIMISQFIYIYILYINMDPYEPFSNQYNGMSASGFEGCSVGRFFFVKTTSGGGLCR